MARGRSVYRAALKEKGVRLAALLPPAVAIAGAAVSWLWLAPATNDSVAGDFSQFFGTSAQVIATLFVALALEAAIFRETAAADTAFATRWGFVFVALGEVAAVTALSTRLPDAIYTIAFGATVGAGLAALTAVVLVAWRNVRVGVATADDELLEAWKEEGDPAAAARIAGR